MYQADLSPTAEGTEAIRTRESMHTSMEKNRLLTIPHEDAHAQSDDKKILPSPTPVKRCSVEIPRAVLHNTPREVALMWNRIGGVLDRDPEPWLGSGTSIFRPVQILVPPGQLQFFRVCMLFL